MSFTAEPEAKTNARPSLINWLRGFSGSVSEHASARELAKMARSFGRGDPMVGRWIRQCEDEEQRIREQRHTETKRQTADQRRLRRGRRRRWGCPCVGRGREAAGPPGSSRMDLLHVGGGGLDQPRAEFRHLPCLLAGLPRLDVVRPHL